jgi:hypothetical protein
MTVLPVFSDHPRPRARRAQPGHPGRPALGDRLPHPWLIPLLVFAATRLLILAAWYGSDAIYGHGHPWTWHFGPAP